MRIFEIILSCLPIIVIVLRVFQHLPTLQKGLIVAIIPILLLHSFLEGPRWQMSLTYLVILVLICSIFFKSFENNTFKWITLLLAFIGILISIILSCILPIFNLPNVRGPYQVIAMNEKTEHDLSYKIWIPSNNKSVKKKSKYLNDIKDIQGLMGMPSFVFGHLKLVKTNSNVSNKSVINKKLPLIIYSHGASSTYIDNTALLEEITSYGYITVAINHNFSFEKYGIDESLARSVNANHQKSLIKQLIQKVIPNQIHNYKNTLSHLKSKYSDQIDFDNIILMGHSLGGTTATSAANEIIHTKGIINMDGPVDSSKSIHMPFLYLSSFSPNQNDDELSKFKVPPAFYRDVKSFELDGVKELIENNRKKSYWVRLKTANHLDFTDLPFMFSLMSSPFYNRDRGHRTKSELILSFIRTTLHSKKHTEYLKHPDVEWLSQNTL